MRSPERFTRLLIAAGLVTGIGAPLAWKAIQDENSKSKPAIAASKPADTPDSIKLVPDPTATATRIPEIATVTPTTAPATAGPSPSPSATEQPSPTAQATATKVEAKKDVPCLILPQEYCSQAEVIDWTSPSGKKSKMIGLKLPANISFTMPIDGQVAKGKLPEGLALKGTEAVISDPNNPNTLHYIIRGDLSFPNMYSLNLKKGEVFGTSQQTGIDNAGGYNVVFYVIRGSGREATAAEDILQEMFPQAFTKPAKSASAPQGSNNNATTYTTTFH